MRKSRSRILYIALLAGLFGLTACADDPSILNRAPAPPSAPQLSQGVQVSQFYAGQPGEGVTFINYPAQNNKTGAGWGSIMTDVIQHLPLSYGNTYYDSDKITYTHETSHGIHSELRNNHNNTGSRANAFYVPGNRAALVIEPGIRKSAAAAYIPLNLRGPRYDLYIAGSPSWDDTPLYIWDEWNAYVNGGEAGVEMAQNGQWTDGWRDGVMGQLEFTVYAIAVAQAVREQDPGYFASNTQFKEFLAFNVQRSMESYRAGAVLPDFQWERQDTYYDAMRNSTEAESWRAFCRELFGDAWANAVLFGQGDVPPDNGDNGDNGDNTPPPPNEDEGDDQPPPPPPLDDNNPDPPQDNDPPLPQDNGDDNPQPPTDPDSFNADNPPPPPPPGGGSGGDNQGDNNPPGDINPPGDVNPPGDQGDPGGDRDFDGIADALDLCNSTPRGQNVWGSGEWIGCAAGEFRDRLPQVQGSDLDVDGIADSDDLCSGTTAGSAVWTYGAWIGCAEGQLRDTDR